MTNKSLILELAEPDRLQVRTWLEAFERTWYEGKLSAWVARELPPARDPLRQATLVGLLKIEMRRRWETQRPLSVEQCLEQFPELASADQAQIDLILVECALRRHSEEPVAGAELARRFPRLAQPVLTRLSESMTAIFPVSPQGHSAVCASTRAAGSAGSAVPELQGQFGRYVIEGKLGQGGMGQVYLAFDTHLERLVALKVPNIAASEEARILQRFYREARAAAKLDDPSICRVYDFGQLEGIHFLTMAYIEGTPLDQLISMNSRLDEREAASVVYTLARAVHKAHALGIIHRDLKPSNVIITSEGVPVILDFGLAHCLREEQRLTMHGLVLGTPAYIAPEQIAGDRKDVGPPCDVYSLGVILYESLTGQPPFDGPPALVMSRVVTEEPPKPSSLRTDLDPSLEAICLQAMARDLQVRYRTPAELADALLDYLRGPATTEPDEGKTAPASARPTTRLTPASDPYRRTPHSPVRPSPMALIGRGRPVTPRLNLPNERQANVPSEEQDGSAAIPAVGPGLRRANLESPAMAPEPPARAGRWVLQLLAILILSAVGSWGIWFLSNNFSGFLDGPSKPARTSARR